MIKDKDKSYIIDTQYFIVNILIIKKVEKRINNEIRNDCCKCHRLK